MLIKQMLMLPLVIISILWAQSEDNMPDMHQVRDMLTIKWEPMGKKVKVLVTGYEAAKLEFHDLYVEASYGLGDFKKTLVVERAADAFLIANPEAAKNIKLKFKVKEQEAFDYDLKLK